jgi:hypothetical protein
MTSPRCTDRRPATMGSLARAAIFPGWRGGDLRCGWCVAEAVGFLTERRLRRGGRPVSPGADGRSHGVTAIARDRLTDAQHLVPLRQILAEGYALG